MQTTIRTGYNTNLLSKKGIYGIKNKSKNHNGEKKCDDKKIEKHYERFGEWRGLVIWCDMTEKWITEDAAASDTAE